MPASTRTASTSRFRRSRTSARTKARSSSGIADLQRVRLHRQPGALGYDVDTDEVLRDADQEPYASGGAPTGCLETNVVGHWGHRSRSGSPTPYLAPSEWIHLRYRLGGTAPAATSSVGPQRSEAGRRGRVERDLRDAGEITPGTCGREQQIGGRLQRRREHRRVHGVRLPDHADGARSRRFDQQCERVPGGSGPRNYTLAFAGVNRCARASTPSSAPTRSRAASTWPPDGGGRRRGARPPVAVLERDGLGTLEARHGFADQTNHLTNERPLFWTCDPGQLEALLA